MNERIKELESQAHELAWQEWKQFPESNNGVKIDANGLGRFKSKFAELLIRECIAQIAEAIPDTDCSASVAYKTAKIAAMSRVKNHFGVESDDNVDDDKVEYCPKCNEEWSGTSCGIPNCGWIVGEEV